MATQRHIWESTVRLFLDGAPVIAATPADVTLKYRRPGEVSFTTKTLDAYSWTNLGDGFYAIAWTEDEMSVVGIMTIQLTGSLFSEIVGSIVVEANAASSGRPGLCTIRGNIAELGGGPSTNEEITFRLAKTPAATPTSILSGGFLRTTADIDGNFSVVLARGATVVVEVPKCGLRATFIVPDADEANLIDVIPPIS